MIVRSACRLRLSKRLRYLSLVSTLLLVLRDEVAIEKGVIGHNMSVWGIVLIYDREARFSARFLR